ncbi:MAG: phage integrase [Nitrosomonas sp.]|nr:MAG: phage integrase [Nitrosomonas sp.]
MGRTKAALTIKAFNKLLRTSKNNTPQAVGGASNLYVSINSPDSASWIFRYSFAGKRRDMGLGSVKDLSLVEAREKASELRKLVRNDIDPIEHVRELKEARKRASIKTVTFQHCAIEYHKSHSDGWSNDKYREQWLAALEKHIFPAIGSLNVADINNDKVLHVLKAPWKDTTITATRLRGRIESILDWATVRQYRTGENPARWKGHLDKLLPKPSKVTKVENHPALPFKEIPQFMQQLRKLPGYAAAAVEFIILTAVRTRELRGAVWSEIDLDKRVWTLSAERMKYKRRGHIVPLSDAAIDVIHRMQEMRISDYIFPGVKEDKPISEGAMLDVLKPMGYRDINDKNITVHGFRSTFRDWASETTAYPHEVCEMALAHTIANRVEAAYRRGDLFDKRKQLMDDWAQYCYKSRTT